MLRSRAGGALALGLLSAALLVTSPALGSPYSDAVLADGPRGYWRLGDSASPAVDASGFGSAGAYGGGVLLGVPGALPGDPDTAAHLDGVNDLVNMGDPASGALDFGTGDFSVELWVRTPLNGERSLVAKRGSAAGSWLLTVTDDSGHAGQIRAGVSDGVVGQQVYSTRAIDDGAWHHVVVVADRDTALRFYVDGAAAGTAPASPPGSVSNTGPFQLGKISGYGHLSGDLDEVAVYAKALTPERISAHYGAAAPDLPATVTIVSGPPNPTAATDATFSFFPSEPASLECSLDGGPFAACVSPHGYSGLAEGLHTARVRAIDLGGQIGPATSYAWRVDLTPPAAPVVSHAPPPLSNDPDDTISFSAESGATFLCRLNLDAFAPCASPFHYTALADGPHAFEVMAVDAAGNSGPTAAVAWLLDTVPPAGPSLTGSPPNPSASGAAEFTFTRSDGVGFLCRFNGSPFVPCASPQTFTGLPDGHHVFDVRTVDEAGNGSEPVRFTWTIERGPPEPTIDSGPAGLTTGTGAQFAFSDTAAEVTYQCRLDTAAFEPCASPRSYAGLTDGTHEFEVRAFFASGWDSPPVSYDWSVDTAAPVAPTVTSRPEEATSSSAATIAFSDGSGPPPPLGAALPAPLPEATGPTYYVATTGSDANPGSETLPWRTVQRALDRLHPGERALVRGGVYEQNLRVNDAGTAEAPMAIEAYPGERPVLRPGVVSPSFPIRVTSDGGYVRVRGFVIEGATGSTSAGVYVSSPAHHVELSNNEIRGGEGHGILLDGDTASVHILGNHIHHNGSPIGGAQKHGIYFQGSDQVAADNVIHDHAFGFGIQVYDENHRSLVVNNTIVRNGKSGVVLGGAVGVDGIRVIGNILAFNSHHGIGHDAIHPTGSQAHDNVIFGNGHGAFDPAGTGIDFSGGNVLADPRFASLTARDFRLLSDSPALGAADPAYTRAAGSRALGGAPDSGALESVVRFECSLDGAAYQACASPSEHSELAEGTHTFLVRSLDDAGNVGAPAEVTWAVDTIAPTTLITGPADPDNDPAPALSFAASEEGASFECALDGADFAACVSPQTYGNLVDGAHVFAARATDGAGNAGPASTHSWTLDTVAPLAPVVDSGPPALTASTSAELMFSSGAAGASFHCSLDGAAATACASPATYAGLGEGGHVFEVTARDAAGNESGAGRHQWTVDGTPPPAPTLTAQPQNVTSSTSAILEFNSAEAEVTFRCRLDDQGAGACSSPQAYGGLVEGAHTFEVEAVDLAGNASIAAVATWVIDVTPPSAPTIDSGPAQLTASRAAELAFSSAETGVSFRCGVDGTPATPCSSPAAYGGLADGGHSFEVKAVDAAGNEGPATTTTWTVDGTAPAAALILAGPPALTRSREAELTFSSVEPGLSFRCSLDGGPPAACASPFSRSDLADGPHAFEVVARDAAGNESAAASRGWTVDGTAPVAPEITSVPPVVGGSSSATFAFSHPEPGVRFVCVLDLGAPAECVSPVNYAGLLPGAHTFSVRALDPAGNESVATAYAWAVVQADPRYEAAVLADAPNGYWRLGELGVPTAIDGSGFGSLGTYLGGVGLGVSGALLRESDTAAHFDGSNDLVAMGDPPSGVLDFGTGDFSLELWARTTANGERTLIAKRASSGPAWLVTVTDDPGQAGHLRVLVTAGSVTRQVYSVVRVDDGAWHHVVIVFDRDAGVGFYVDGLAAGFSAGALTATVSNAASFQLGKTSGYAYFTGDLDEVAVYPTLLGEPRIRAHHDAGRG